MLHGLLGNSKNFASIAPLLSTSHSRLVICLDLPDHGSESNWGEEEEEVITYPLMSKCVVDFLDWAGIETCTVIGHSMGGKVAMAMATDPVYQGRLEGLVVIDIAPVTYEAGESKARSEATSANDVHSTEYIYSSNGKNAVCRALSAFAVATRPVRAAAPSSCTGLCGPLNASKPSSAWNRPFAMPPI